MFVAMVGDIAMLQPVILPFPEVYHSGAELIAKSSGDTIWGVLEGAIRDQRSFKQMEDCAACDGTGLYAEKSWDSDEIPCDECGGSGEVEVDG